MATTAEIQTILLSSGQQMPLLGLGSWQSKPEETERAVEAALEAGYRHIDTAFNYRNEEAIGNALKRWIESGRGNRSDLFIVTKLPHVGMRASDVSNYLSKSLSRLQLDYIDLYLVHLPFGFIADESGETAALTPNGGPQLDMQTDHVAIWKAMEAEVDAGRTRAIGISNFNPSQVTRILEQARIRPAALQVELHALHQQRPLRAFCAQVGLPLVAYSPLASPAAATHFQDKYGHLSSRELINLLEHPVVTSIAKLHNKSPAQVLLRHTVQRNITVIPKSITPSRIQENCKIFDFQLSDEEVKELDKLDLEGAGRIFDFLFFKGVETHPEYPFPEYAKH